LEVVGANFDSRFMMLVVVEVNSFNFVMGQIIRSSCVKIVIMMVMMVMMMMLV
jgi:hypothetical protein